MSAENENKISFTIITDILKNSLRVSKMIWKERKGQVIVLIFIFIIVSMRPFFTSGSSALLINELVRDIGNNQFSYRIVLFLILLIVARFIPTIFYIIQEYIDKLFFLFLGEKFELLIVKKKGEIDIATHEDPEHNNLLNKVAEGGIFRIQGFTDRQFFILQNIVEVLVAAIVLVVAKWWIFLIILVGTIPELIVEAKYGRRIWGIYDAKGETRRKFWNLKKHFDWTPYLIELKIFQNTNHFISSIKEMLNEFNNEERKNEKVKFKQELISLVLSQGVMAFATGWFVFEVVKGHLLIGTFTFFLASIGSLRQSLSSFFRNLGRQYQDNLFVTDIFKFLDIKPTMTKPQKGIILDSNKTPEIVFDNISFVYPNANKPVLKNFSLKIPSGEKIALIGLNGAGKTTIIKLLCRFYDPTSGKITIDGYDLKDIDIDSWYSKIGALFQDYAAYQFTVKKMVALGRTNEEESIEKVKKAAKASESDSFIEEWENKYDQMLGKQFTGGIEPSIGQWQKLALARTFYRDPKILILDEPTSSIDAEAEAKIFERLEALPKDRTVILISHRFSTVRRASHIAVVEKGTVKEFGTHNQLLKLKGTYAKLFKLQAKGYQ